MPKRVIDFDAMWGSDKLASCAEWAQAEYAWLYGLADASGCFELTNLRVIWGRVAAVRRNLTIERLEQVFGEFQDKGLLFVWEHEGKRYGHWTGSDVPGRLPPPSWRMRLEKLAPPVPKQLFAEYVSRFARGRAALAGGGFPQVMDHQSLKEKFEGAGVSARRSDVSLRRPDPRFESSDLNFESSEIGAQRSYLKSHGSDLTLQSAYLKSESSDFKCHGSDSNSRRSDLTSQQSEPASQSSDLKFESSNLKSEKSGAKSDGLESLKGCLELDQAQDWNLAGDLKEGGDGSRSPLTPEAKPSVAYEVRNSPEESRQPVGNSQSFVSNLNSTSGDLRPEHIVASRGAPVTRTASAEASGRRVQGSLGAWENPAARAVGAGVVGAGGPWAGRDKSAMVARELNVGRGPTGGPAKVKAEALERIRAREAARRGSRSP